MTQLYQKGADHSNLQHHSPYNTAKKQQHLQPQVNKLSFKATPNQYTAQNIILHKYLYSTLWDDIYNWGSTDIAFLKGLYDAFLNIIILCIWCNRIYVDML